MKLDEKTRIGLAAWALAIINADPENTVDFDRKIVIAENLITSGVDGWLRVVFVFVQASNVDDDSAQVDVNNAVTAVMDTVVKAKKTKKDHGVVDSALASAI